MKLALSIAARDAIELVAAVSRLRNNIRHGNVLGLAVGLLGLLVIRELTKISKL